MSVGMMAREPARLGIRRRRAEIMDGPGLEVAEHDRALAGLARVNWVCGSSRVLWRALRPVVASTGGKRMRILDIASGAGDVAIGLWRRARRAGIRAEVLGIDISPTAIAHATRRAARHHAEVRFAKKNALRDDLPDGFDVITSTLFLHHLADPDAAMLLSRMAEAARRAVLVYDLTRGRFCYWMANLGTRALSRSEVIRRDAGWSVESAFTIPELRRIAKRAGLADATIEPRFPGRMLLTWTR